MNKDTLFASVPDEILIRHIFVHFSFEDLLRCRLVCRQFRRIGSGDLEIIKKVYQATVSVRKLFKTGRNKQATSFPEFHLREIPTLVVYSPDFISVNELNYQLMVPDKLDIKENFFNNLLKFLRDPVNVMSRIKKKITWWSREKKSAMKKGKPFKIIEKEIAKLQTTQLNLKYAMQKKKGILTGPPPKKKRTFDQMIEEDVIQDSKSKKNRRN